MYRLVEAIATKSSLETGKACWEHTDVAGLVLLDHAITQDECAALREAINSENGMPWTFSTCTTAYAHCLKVTDCVAVAKPIRMTLET